MPYNKFIDPYLGPVMPGPEPMLPSPTMSPMQVTPPGSQGSPLGGAMPERPNIPRDKWEKIAMAVIMASMIAGKKRRGIHELAGGYLMGKGGQRIRAEGEWQKGRGEQEKQAQWMREMTLASQKEDRRRIDQRLFREAGWEQAAAIRGEGREYQEGIAEEDRRREEAEDRQEELQRMRALDAFPLEDRRWLEMGLRPPAGPKPLPTLGEGAAGILGAPIGELSPADLDAYMEQYKEKGRGARARISAAGVGKDEGIPYGPVEARKDQTTLDKYWGTSQWQDEPGMGRVGKAAWLRMTKAGLDPGLPMPTSSGPPVAPGPGFFERLGQWYRARKTMPLTDRQKAVIAQMQARNMPKDEQRRQFREAYGYEMP